MENKLISFETAILAKEKGFNIPTQKAYIGEKLFTNFEESFGEREFYFDADNFYENWNKKGWVFNKDGNECFGCKLDNIKWFEAYSAPTQSLLQRWLREVHNIHVWCKYVEKGYEYFIGVDQSEGWFEYFEEALEAGLQEALKLIKDDR